MERISDRLFVIEILGRIINISTEKLKPAYAVNLETVPELATSAQPTSTASQGQALRTYPAPKAKKAVQIASALLEGEYCGVSHA